MVVYLICDESGAKGYADIPEQYPGEAGVFAGFFITEPQFEAISADLRSISNKYFGDEKCHIRGLPQNKMELLRKDIFDMIKFHRLPCVYEAIHVEGLKREYERILSIKDMAKAANKSDIKMSGVVKPPLLHEELFQGLFSKSIAFFMDHFDKVKDQLRILLDPVDLPILKKFKKSANEVSDFSPTVTHVTGWDPSNKEVLRGKISVSISFSKSLGIDEFEEVDYQIESAACHMTMPADILANSINHIFKKRSPGEVGKPLHDRSSIQVHELFDLFYGLINDDDDEQAWVTDITYMHPLHESRIK